MFNELNHVCEIWKRDVAEGINCQSRKLKLADIPLIGKVLTSVDMDEVVIQDPLLLPKEDFGYFLFLNDLLRSPTSRTAYHSNAADSLKCSALCCQPFAAADLNR